MNIWVPKFKILEPKSEIKVSCGFRGEYQLHARRPDGLVRASTPWFSNLILDAGFNRLGSSPGQSQINHCVVGTGTTAPTRAQTSLEALVASTTSLTALEQTVNSSVLPYYLNWLGSYRFALGAATGNLTEVGVGWGTSTLFSRELIRDVNGDPTSFTVLADEQLDVLYRIRCYMPEGDVVGTISVTGSGTHDFVARANRIQAVGTWAFAGPTLYGLGPRPSSSATAWSGPIGTIFENPSGTTTNGNGLMSYSGGYVADTFTRNVSATWGLNNANYAGGIGATTWNLSGANSYNRHFQFGFTPNIVKDNTQTLELIVSISHAYADPPP